MEKRPPERNAKFHECCMVYFNALRKKGVTDFAFEDEYYFTMPAISGKMRI